MIIPDKVATVGNAAFWGCNGFNGYLLLGEALKIVRGAAFAQSGYNYDATNVSARYRSYAKHLNFSKVYCKALTPPTVRYSETTLSDKNEYPDFGDYLYQDQMSSFGVALFDEGLLPNLIVQIGRISAYQSSNWGDIFELIEEGNF
mgnify:CR=1 FL=1